MSVVDIIQGTVIVIRGAYTIAVMINQSEELHEEIRQTANRVSKILQVAEGTVDQLEKLAHRVTVDGEKFIISSTNSVKLIVTGIENVLHEVHKERGFIKRFLMNKERYQRQLNESSQQLTDTCCMIQGIIPGLAMIHISSRKFPNFRTLFPDLSDKKVSIFDFLIDKNTSNTILKIATEHFDPAKRSCFMKLQTKLRSSQFFISYQLRTWSTPKPISSILEKRRKEFVKLSHTESTPNLAGSNASLNSIGSTHSVPSANAAAASNVNHEKLDFSEFFFSHDDICGMALTQSMMYIATKYQITVYSLDKQKILAQHGTEGDGPNSFKHISDIYIPPNNETNLYIVDRGRNVVFQYKINNSGLCFEYVLRYFIIGKHNQDHHLQSCAIYNDNLFVTDSGNNCIHVFPLSGQRQSFCLFDDSVTPFSPGPICAHDTYLYVADCSTQNPSILVLNEECEPVDWFRNVSLRQILAIDIEQNFNELFILTTTMVKDGNNELQKRPMIVSMDLCIRSANR